MSEGTPLTLLRPAVTAGAALFATLKNPIWSA